MRSELDRQTGRLLTLDTLPYYIGGFLGPFGTLVVIAIYPELRKTFDASSQAVTWGFSGYFLPMALIMLVSGTIGERYGRRRVMRITYLGYAAATVVAIAAPTLGWFIAARVLQGIGNAFITPLLLAGLADITPPRQLGKAMGIYSSFQAGGGAIAPFAGGFAARTEWRLAFVAIAVAALLLSLRPPPGEPRLDVAAPPIRPLLKPNMVVLWVVGLAAATGPIGISVVVGVASRDALGATSTQAGLILLLGGAAAMVIGPQWGRMLDVFGVRRFALIGTTAASAAVAIIGFAGSLPALAVIWLLAATLIPAIVVALTNVAAIAVPANRGGALSSVLAFRFLGHALGPLIWVPVFDQHHRLAFLGAGSLGLISLVGFAVTTRSIDDPAPA